MGLETVGVEVGHVDVESALDAEQRRKQADGTGTRDQDAVRCRDLTPVPQRHRGLVALDAGCDAGHRPVDRSCTPLYDRRGRVGLR